MTIFMQTMLRSQVGTFVGPNGLRFYRCAISQVSYNTDTIHGIWKGMPVAYDISYWFPTVKVEPGTLWQTHIDDKEDFTLYRMKLNGHEYELWLPKNVHRGDELLFSEMRMVPNGYVQEVRLQ